MAESTTQGKAQGKAQGEAQGKAQGKAQGATRQLFIDMLAQANIPEDFFKEILIENRILSFRTAMSLDDV